MDTATTTVGLSGHKSIPLYGSAEAFRFSYDVVYTNVMSAGAYRGYGATQGIFALESAVNELAQTLHMDPTVLRAKNMVREGQMMPAYYGETTRSCALDRCLERAKEMIGWDEKYPCYDCGNGKVRGVGVAMAMQGSGISGVDTGAVEIKVNDDGFYSLMIGATDMGTGCDTILTQMAAECLECEMEDIVVHGADTDNSPYDCGSYASSTTYVTGMAVVKTCETLRKKICERGAEYLGCSPDDVEFDGEKVVNLKTKEEITRKEIGNKVMCSSNAPLSATEAFSSPVSPPPFMVGIAEVEIDKETGVVEPIDYAAVVDCGTVVNPNLARVQTEGESPRESEWRFMRISFTAKKERTTVIPLCSIKYRAVLMSERSVWNSRAVMNRQDLSAQKSIERLLSILRLLQFQMQFKMQSE